MKQAGSGNTLAAIGLMIVSTSLVATQDTFSKELTTALPVSQILAVRFVAMSLFAVVWLWFHAGVRRALRSASPMMQIVRCLTMCAEVALFTYALRFLGIAEIHAIFAAFPLIVTALSVPLLRERVGWQRWLAVGFGFLGTLAIIRPGSGVFDPAALLGVGCALLYALYNLLTRRVSLKDSFATSMLYLALVGLVASGAFAVFQWQPVPPSLYGYLIGVCITSIIAHLLLIKALALVSAVILQPLNYLILVWAVAIGYFVYGETLDSWQIAGALVVVLSGVYVGWREYLISRSR